jgi:2-octaprenylphenol hydroxylase
VSRDKNQQDFDIVIVGGGIVGLSFACELADTDFSVALVERNELEPLPAERLPAESLADRQLSCRVSAINRFALQRFKDTGVSQSAFMQQACVFEKMFVWEQAGAGQIQFDSAELGVSELGIIIENSVLQHMLLERVMAADNIQYLCPQQIEHIAYQPGEQSGGQSDMPAGQSASIITLSSGETLRGKLLVGADGAASKVGAVAAIERSQQSYQQQGLVCNVSTSESHQHTAWQCFMPTGPLALLPLYNNQSSIVWSLDDAVAKQYMALDDASFRQVLAEACEYRLGEITGVGQRFAFPLKHGHASDYVKPGLALIGDAAHSIHPLAGQGANLGIADAAVLAETISQAKAAGRQWASQHTLSKYQRQRKGANQMMELSMTGFKELFGCDNAVLSELRNAGLSLVDHLPALKYRIIKQALGV